MAGMSNKTERAGCVATEKACRNGDATSGQDDPSYEVLSAFRDIVGGRGDPDGLPAGIHANPVMRNRNQRDAEACARIACEVARILSSELGIDSDHERTLCQVIVALGCMPGGCLPDASTLLRSETSRIVLALETMPCLPIAEACEQMGVSEETYWQMAAAASVGPVRASGKFMDKTYPATEQGRDGDWQTSMTPIMELLGRCSIEPLCTVVRMDDDDATELLDMLSPVLEDPRVACRLSSVWHPDATPEALSREQARRNRILDPESAVDVLWHARKIEIWDGEEALSEICPDESEQSALLEQVRYENRRRVIGLIAERERVRQVRLRMWREQTGESVPFDEWQREQLGIWNDRYNRDIGMTAWHDICRGVRSMGCDDSLGDRYVWSDEYGLISVFAEDEEAEWRMVRDAEVIAGNSSMSEAERNSPIVRAAMMRSVF